MRPSFASFVLGLWVTLMLAAPSPAQTTSSQETTTSPTTTTTRPATTTSTTPLPQPPSPTSAPPPAPTAPPPTAAPTTAPPPPTVPPEVINQINALQAELNQVAQRLTAAEAQRVSLETKFRANQVKVDLAQAHAAEVHATLQRRVVAAYKGNDAGLLAIVLGSETTQSLLDRRNFVEAVFSSDASTLSSFRDARARLLEEQKTLQALTEEQARVAASIKTEKDRLTVRLDDLQRLVKTSLPGADQRAPFPINGFVFPVGQPHTFSSDYGDFRIGPPVHSHQGNDIFAPRNTPLFAVAAGVVDVSDGGLGGRQLGLSAADGTYYYYAHLESFAVANGTQVRAGQVVGYVGDSGNALGGATHCHFEIHPGGGATIDPFFILTAADRGATQSLLAGSTPQPTVPAATDTITPLPEIPPRGLVD